MFVWNLLFFGFLVFVLFVSCRVVSYWPIGYTERTLTFTLSRTGVCGVADSISVVLVLVHTRSLFDYVSVIDVCVVFVCFAVPYRVVPYGIRNSFRASFADLRPRCASWRFLRNFLPCNSKCPPTDPFRRLLR